MLNAIDKVFFILDQFTNEKPQWGVRELSIKTGLPPNLTHWYLKNLERNRVVRKDRASDNTSSVIAYSSSAIAIQNIAC